MIECDASVPQQPGLCLACQSRKDEGRSFEEDFGIMPDSAVRPSRYGDGPTPCC